MMHNTSSYLDGKKLIFIISTIKCKKKCEWCRHCRGSSSQDQIEQMLSNMVKPDTLVVNGFGEPIRQYNLYNIILNLNADYSIISRLALTQPKLAARYNSVRLPIFSTDPIQSVVRSLLELKSTVPQVYVYIRLTNDNDVKYCISLLPWLNRLGVYLVPEISNIHMISESELSQLRSIIIKKHLTVIENITYPIDGLAEFIDYYFLNAYNGTLKCPKTILPSMLCIEANSRIKPCPFLPASEVLGQDFYLYDNYTITQELTKIYDQFCGSSSQTAGCNWFIGAQLAWHLNQHNDNQTNQIKTISKD